ncbi:MAG: KOW domain-containing RNA-binding protein [Firmicutes bacterium]|jgi:ribosomal protein L14E/L6E/L27E|nr:KOW domain-containing RNA-binding protein [Bacillota bacterium]
MPRFRIGQIVTSRAGRDAGRTFVVVGADGDAVVVADGDLRKVENAKRKNAKHLVAHDWVEPGLESRIMSGEKVTNAEIRRVVEAWRSRTAGGGR